MESLTVRPFLPSSGTVLPPERNPHHVYIASLGVGSRRALSACLHRIAAMVLTAHGSDPGPDPAAAFPWAALRTEHTATIRALIERQCTRDGSRPWSPAYRNKHLAALRGVLAAGWRLGLMTTDEYHRARTVKDFPGSRLPAGRSINLDEFVALLAVCAADPSPAGRRDAALLALLYTTGARRAEIAALCREHYDPGTRGLRIVGKGDKQRREYLHPHAATLLGAWLALDDAPCGPLLKPVHKSGSIQDRPLSGSGIRHIVNKRRTQAGLPSLSPHDFRRTFIGELLDAGTDLPTVQELVGHASPATTARYDRRPERKRRTAVDRLPFPVPPPVAV